MLIQLTPAELVESARIRGENRYVGPEPQYGPRRVLENPRICPIRCRKLRQLEERMGHGRAS